MATEPNRMEGDENEADAWTKAFSEAKPDAGDAPLSEQERAAVNMLMLRAAELGDTEMVDTLAELAKNPAELRRRLADFSPEEEAEAD